METKVEIQGGNRGFAIAPKVGVLTFEVQDITSREELVSGEYKSIYKRYASENACVSLGEFRVPLWGDGHNLYPQEVFSIISENKLLPEVIEKQVRFLFGRGPRLYKEVIEGEGFKKRRLRMPVEDEQIQAWLESWEEKGFPHYWEYLKNLITDYYHVKTCVSKYHLTRARRLNEPGAIAALTYVGSDEARLAAKGDFLHRRIKNEDCKYVIVGDWINISAYEYQVFPRFEPLNPYKHASSIAFNIDKTFSKWVYAYNDWFKGLYEWIKASNLSPRYLNSYLRNALNAHVHVIIPGTWYLSQKQILENICQSNLMGDPETPIQVEYKGVKLVDDAGKPYRFFETMMDDLISGELRRITELMSGEGKNQGKLYATTKWGEDGWKFEEFPGKFQEYFKSVIDYDKRADQVILAGKGISSSITNVENDGVISKSGSDVYYNYLIYVATLTLDEFFITKELNRAIQFNFPHAKKENIRLGFWIDIPSKMDETTAADRLSNTATPDPKKP